MLTGGIGIGFCVDEWSRLNLSSLLGSAGDWLNWAAPAVGKLN